MRNMQVPPVLGNPFRRSLAMFGGHGSMIIARMRGFRHLVAFSFVPEAVHIGALSMEPGTARRAGTAKGLKHDEDRTHHGC